MPAPEDEAEYDRWLQRAQAAMDAKAKPPGSLGLLEEWAVRLCALQRSLQPRLSTARLVVFAADHGVTAEGQASGVSAYPRALTASVFAAVAAAQSACAALCAANDVSLELIDVGVDGDLSRVCAMPGAAADIRVVHAKVRHGSASMLAGPALAPADLEAALEVGAAAARRAAAAAPSPDTALLCVGELGIGNTTAAAALLAALTGLPPEDVCGRGTGLDDAGLERKREVVAAALRANAASLEGGRPLAALAAVGGLELAAMAGAYLEAGRLGMPCLVDGFISTVAAAAAVAEDSRVASTLFYSHASAERGAAAALAAAGASAGGGRAALAMGLRLGEEGSGAVLAVPLLRAAAALMRDMGSLQEVMAASAAVLGPGPQQAGLAAPAPPMDGGDSAAA